jgi:hypothetical protein
MGQGSSTEPTRFTKIEEVTSDKDTLPSQNTSTYILAEKDYPTMNQPPLAESNDSRDVFLTGV